LKLRVCRGPRQPPAGVERIATTTPIELSAEQDARHRERSAEGLHPPGELEKHGDGWLIRYQTTAGGPPEQDDVVRVTPSFGRWQPHPAAGGAATIARYESNMDLAGSGALRVRAG
jgi:hypothetical protein